MIEFTSTCERHANILQSHGIGRRIWSGLAVWKIQCACEQQGKEGTFVARSWGVVLGFGRRPWGSSVKSRVRSAVFASSATSTSSSVVFALTCCPFLGGHRSRLSGLGDTVRATTSSFSCLESRQSFTEVSGHRRSLSGSTFTFTPRFTYQGRILSKFFFWHKTWHRENRINLIRKTYRDDS